MSRQRKVINSEQSRQRFLDELARGASVGGAAKLSGSSERTLYRLRKADAKFAEAWAEAYEAGTDALEAEAQRRAVEGVEEAVYYQGERCGTVRKYSDTLLIFLMKARDPKRFCDRARTADLMRRWAKDDGASDTTLRASEAVIALLDNLALNKADMARKPS